VFEPHDGLSLEGVIGYVNATHTEEYSTATCRDDDSPIDNGP
jgi:hypothetical protein